MTRRRRTPPPPPTAPRDPQMTYCRSCGATDQQRGLACTNCDEIIGPEGPNATSVLPSPGSPLTGADLNRAEARMSQMMDRRIGTAVHGIRPGMRSGNVWGLFTLAIVLLVIVAAVGYVLLNNQSKQVDSIDRKVSGYEVTDKDGKVSRKAGLVQKVGAMTKELETVSREVKGYTWTNPETGETIVVEPLQDLRDQVHEQEGKVANLESQTEDHGTRIGSLEKWKGSTDTQLKGMKGVQGTQSAKIEALGERMGKSERYQRRLKRQGASRDYTVDGLVRHAHRRTGFDRSQAYPSWDTDGDGVHNEDDVEPNVRGHNEDGSGGDLPEEMYREEVLGDGDDGGAGDK